MKDDLIRRQAVLDTVFSTYCRWDTEDPDDLKNMLLLAFQELPAAQLERKWIPCSNPPKHHRDVLVRGKEAIGNVTVHKVMQWDVDTWRPIDYAPSITWEEWSEI